MYLSRVEIDTKKTKTLQALSSPEILHGIVESCFSGDKQRNLWRIDTLNGRLYLLLLSREIPDFTTLMQQIGVPGTQCESRSYEPLLNRIEAGSIWRFRLTANPVMSVPDSQGKRGKLRAITPAASQREWMIRQGKQHGFLVAPGQFDVVRSEWLKFRNKGRNLSIFCSTFEGILTVTDADQFREALTDGIGRAKSYGMGLITVMSHG